MNWEPILAQRLLCIATLDTPADAVPLAEALLAGGLNVLEITFRTAGAAEAIRRIREALPPVVIGAGTLLTADHVQQAVDAGAQFGVAPGLSERVSTAAHAGALPLLPGVATPSEILRAMELGWTRLKFFPAETYGGVKALQALAGPFGHAGVQFVPTGGITAASLCQYLGVPTVAAVGGSWMAERRLVAERAWDKITALAAEAVRLAAGAAS